MAQIPMTRNGLEALKKELQRLKSVDRPGIIEAIAEARAQGDLSENAEYESAKEKQGFIEGRIADIEAKISQAEVIDPASLNAGGRCVFGATIEENLRKIQPNISEREFEEILEISGLKKVLEELPNGISTEINQFGMPLSQGDRVTLALARGLMAWPRILLLDNFT